MAEAETRRDRRRRYERVLGIVERNTNNDKQGPMVSRTTVRQLASQAGIGASDAQSALRAAGENGELLEWHGQVAPATEAGLLAVIQAEGEAEHPRRPLIARAQQMLRAVREGDSA